MGHTQPFEKTSQLPHTARHQILWAFATLIGKADSTAAELAGLLGALAEGFESEGAGGGEGLDAATACDVLWSFATIGHPAHSLCEAMARDLVDKVGLGANAGDARCMRAQTNRRIHTGAACLECHTVATLD